MDCLVGMTFIRDKSVDMILCDLPYGTTACKWDIVIPFEPLWEQYKRIIKDNGAIVLFGREPFSSLLRTNDMNLYRYDWKWRKTRPSRYVQAKKMPLSYHEDLMVFYKNLPVYNPQFTDGKPYIKRHKNTTKPIVAGEEKRNGTSTVNNGTRYPSDIIEFSNSNKKSLHPTQKPVALCEYLIKTYTNKGELVLDNCAGSGTTAIACLKTKRDYILMEKDVKIFEIARNRIENWGSEGEENA